MKAIFWPAVLLMLRLPNEKKLPLMLVVFFALQKQFVSGLTLGSTKG